MTNKSSTVLVIGVISFLVLITIIGLAWVFVFTESKQVSVITPQCSMVESGRANLEYLCPEGFLCRATPVLGCTQEGDLQIVVGRTDDFDYSTGWLAFNRFQIEGGLISYQKSNTYSNTQCKPIDRLCEEFTSSTTSAVIDLPLGVKGNLCSAGYLIVPNTGTAYNCNTGSGAGYNKVVKYTQGGSANVNPSTSDCDSSLTECIGGARYFCQESVNLIKPSGSSSSIATLTYAKEEPSPPSAPITGATYSPSSTPAFQPGDKLQFSKIDFERWLCPEQATACWSSTGVEMDVGEKICASNTALESCVFNQQTGNAELRTTTVTKCCLTDSVCNDNSPLTQDVCVQNTCENRQIQGACSTASDCSHIDQLCVSNQCVFPTTGAYCSSSESSNSVTRCSGQILEVCRPVAGLSGAFKWQLSQDCSLQGKVCV